jgi:hypothetical protein
MAGSKCQICGYQKNQAALSFHHLNPSEKEFKLDLRSLSNRKFEKTLKELEKVMLVCSNCHAELHHPELSQAAGSAIELRAH